MERLRYPREERAANMREIMVGALAVVVAIWLTGCQSAAEESAELARGLARECMDGLAGEALPKGLDAGRICSCAIKGSVEGRDVRQLRALVEKGPGPAELDARGACIVAEARGAGLLSR